MSFILALDQGTSCSRALVFDHDGNICGLARQEIRQIFPRPGLVEHDAEEIWAAELRRRWRRALERSKGWELP